jgi:hypothetical protein
VVEAARSLSPCAGDAGLRAALADLDAYREPSPDCEPNSPEQLAVEVFLTQCARAVP